MPPRPVSTSSPRAASQSQTLTRLFQARSEWDRLYQLSNLLKEAQIDLPDFFDSSIGTSICREPDSEKLAWRLAREIHRRNNGKIPASLQPYLDRPDFEQQEHMQQAETFRRELLDWLSDAPGGEFRRAPSRPARRVENRAGLRSARGARSIDLRVNSPKLKEGSRNFFQVRGLCNEAANGPSFSPPTTRCCSAGSAISCRCCSPTRTVRQPLPARQPQPADVADAVGHQRPLPVGGRRRGRVQPAQRAHRAAASSRGPATAATARGWSWV